jgi:hypothetical protein
MRFVSDGARLAIRIVLACALYGAAAAAQQEAPAEPPPTAIEEAIIEHACGALHPAGSLESSAYLECRQGQLLSLRNDFGRDLRRLSAAQRGAIDSACSGLRAPQGQDAYVACLAARLATLRPRSGDVKPDGSSAGATAASAVTPAAEATPGPATPGSRSWLLPIVLLVAVAAAGGTVVVLRTRRAFGTCRTCGVKLLEQGDLCPACRHDAAETRRRATAERAAEERGREEEQQRQAARDEEQRQQRAADEEARRRQIEEAEVNHRRQQEEEAERRRQEDARRERQNEGSAAENEDDPYAVLSVAPNASAADVDAAYAAARKKYDLELVADMGVELVEHFKRKGEAVERAYQLLASRRLE